MYCVGEETTFKDKVMYYMIGSFVLGMIVMDFMWAYKLGLVHRVYNRVFNKHDYTTKMGSDTAHQHQQCCGYFVNIHSITEYYQANSRYKFN